MEPEAIYLYRDAEDRVVYRKLRFPGKKYRMQRPDGNGGWIDGITDQDGKHLVTLVLYNFPTVLNTSNGYMFVVEGEKDANTLTDNGLVASCNPLGAGKWRDSYSQYFADRNVVVLPDNDEAGRDHARKVVKSVWQHSPSSVRVVSFLDLPYKGDVTDWLEDGNPIADLLEIVETTRPVTEADIERDLKTIIPPEPSKRFRFLSAKEIMEMPRPEWLIDDLIPKGSFTLIYGEPATAKSFLGLDMALSVQSGIEWEAGGRGTRQGTAAFILGEGVGGVGDRVKAWMKDHDLEDMQKVWFLATAPQILDPDELQALVDEIYRLQEPLDLLVLDTLARSTIGADENSSRDMGQFVAAVDRIREEHGCAVAVIHHSSKDGKVERGSSALKGAVDVVMKVKKTKKPEIFEVSCEKTKDAPPFDPFFVMLEQVDLGEEKTSCVLVKCPENLLPNGGDGAKPSGTKEILDVLEDSANRSGTSYTALKRESGLSDGTFNRALKYLKRKGIIKNTGSACKTNYMLAKEDPDA